MAQSPQPSPATRLPSPLQQAGVAPEPIESKTLSLREVTDMAVLRLHSLEDAPTLASRLSEAGVVLPQKTNAVGGENPTALCLRPGEWLLLGESGTAAQLRERISARLDPSLTILHDLSDGLGVFRLAGVASPWLLGKLSGLDFLAGVSAGRHAARTRMADIAVVLHFHPEADGPPRFDLVFDRSLAKHLWDVLTDAAPHAEELQAVHGAAT